MMKNYMKAKGVWDALSLAERKNILNRFGRNKTLSCRSYPFLPKEIRSDIQPGLLKNLPQITAPNYQAAPHWTEIY
jgi:hypothetical protein